MGCLPSCAMRPTCPPAQNGRKNPARQPQRLFWVLALRLYAFSHGKLPRRSDSSTKELVLVRRLDIIPVKMRTTFCGRLHKVSECGTHPNLRSSIPIFMLTSDCETKATLTLRAAA